MLIQESFHDVQTSTGPMRVFLFTPVIPNYPQARFPAVIVYSEIYQVTGPVSRFAKDIAGQGYIAACPSAYHEFVGPEALAYDGPGTDKGNQFKVEKKLEAYDEDVDVTVNYLSTLPNFNGKIGSTGMCLGGHLALRAAFNKSVTAACCFFGTDIHHSKLGTTTNEKLHSLERIKNGDLSHAELIMIHGKMDPHVPLAGRTIIRNTMDESGVCFTWFEPAWAQHAFVRDESSKGRYDPALTKVSAEMMFELFNRCLRQDLGPREGAGGKMDPEC